MDASLRPEDWAREAAALRRVARALVGDEHDSEDLVQSAWLAALERKPERVSPAWLQRVLRNRALDALRARRSRPRAELHEADERRLPAADQVAERIELHRLLIEAVGELKEPYRRTLYLRYFDDLGPTAIAELLQVPVKTVKTRLARGLEQLRERLRGRLGHDDWRPSLALLASPPTLSGPLAAVPTTLVLGGAALMAKKILLAAAAGLFLFGWWRWNSKSAEAEPARGATVQAAVDDPDPDPDPPAPSAVSVVDEERRVQAPSAPAPAEVAEAPAAPTTGSLVVHVLDAAGQDVPAASVDLRQIHKGLPYQGLARVTGDGRGSARFADLRPGIYRVTVDRGGADLFGDHPVRAGEEQSIEFRLRAGVEVDGRVVDLQGRPVEGASIWLTTGRRDWQGGNLVTTTDAAGSFLLRDVPRDQSLGAVAPGRAPTRLVDLDDVDTSGPSVEIELRFEAPGGDLRGRVLRSDGSPVAGVWVAAGALPRGFAAWSQVTEPWTPRPVLSGPDGTFEVFGLVPGRVPVEAYDPRFPVWSGAAEIVVGRTAELEIQLVDGVTVEGRVVDEHGAPLAEAVLRAFAHDIDRDFLPSGQFDFEGTFGYPATLSDAQGRYVLGAVSPGTAWLFASPPEPADWLGYGPRMRAEHVLRAAPGERSVWNPVLEEGHVLEGFVTYRDGAAMPEVFVTARATGADGREVRQTLHADEEGRFRFLNMELAPHALSVQLWDPPEGAGPLVAEDVWPDRGEVHLAADFDAPADEPEGIVSGEIDDVAGRLTGREVVVTFDSGNSSHYAEVTGGTAFRSSLPPGRYRPTVLAGERAVCVGEWFELAAGQRLELDDLVTRPGGTLVLRLQREEGTRSTSPTLYVRADGVFHGRNLETGTLDEVRVEDLLAGPSTYSLYGKGMASVSEKVEIPEGGEVVVDVPLRAAGLRRFEVSWPDGRALGVLDLRILDAQGIEVWAVSESNAGALPRPYLRSTQLALGRYVVEAGSHAGLTATLEFEVTELGAEVPPLRLEMK